MNHLRKHLYPSPIGTLLIACQEEEDMDGIILWLDEYFGGKKPEWMPKIQLSGTDFQQRVWKLLMEIPYGETTTYGELAKKISPTMSAQAIGQAVGKNPCCIIVPCHRVVGANGSLGGYAYGTEMKHALLEFEKTNQKLSLCTSK